MTSVLKKRKKDMDMTSGPIWNKIILFAIPIALTALMQQLFHSVDMAVIGKFTGKNELAAVGSNNSIINLLVNIFMGFSAGSNVVIAQLLGAKKIKTAKKAVYTSLSIALFSGIIITVIGVTASRFMLELISSPPEVIDLATTYLRIYFLGTPFTMVYNFSAAILRSRGETTKPFSCLFAGGILNVFLNLLFVIVFKWSVAGVAIATVISNALSCFMIVCVLCRDKGELGIKIREIRIDKFIFSRIIKIGLPMAIQASLFPLSNMMVQSSVNSLGTIIIAGYATSTSIESYTYSLMTGFDQANVTFVSQNFGAKNIKRCKKSMKLSILFNFILTTAFNLIMLVFAKSIIGMFTSDPEVALVAKQKLEFMYCIFGINIFMNGLTNTLRGLGYSFVPTAVSLVGVCGFRVIWLLTAFKKFPNLYTILAVYPISWLLVVIGLLVMYIIIMRRLEKKTQ